MRNCYSICDEWNIRELGFWSIETLPYFVAYILILINYTFCYGIVFDNALFINITPYYY